MENLSLVFLGGGFGAVCRYLITTWVGSRSSTAFPFGTLAVNCVSCFLMGLIMGIILTLTVRHGLIEEHYRLALTVGFLGGLSTLSSLTFETLTLIRGSSYLLALINITSNVVIALLLTAAGFALSRLIVD